MKAWLKGLGLAVIAAAAAAVSQAAAGGHVGKETIAVALSAVVTAIGAYFVKAPSQSA